MSAGSVSLQSAIQTCRFEVGQADRIQSARWQDPALMLCPIWNGFDTAGRKVCADSFMTKSYGCNNPLDRVQVENNLRPAYTEYVNISALGIQGPDYTGVTGDPVNKQNWHYQAAGDNVHTRQGALNQTGQFGQQFNELRTDCSNFPDQKAFAQEQYVNRQNQARQVGYYANQSRQHSGF